MQVKRSGRNKVVLWAAGLLAAGGVGLFWVSPTGCCQMGRPVNMSAAAATTLPASTAPARADLLEGDWSGTWTSTSNNMGGALKCAVLKQPDGHYQAKFDAIFAKVLTHQSVVTLKVRERGPTWKFGGEEDLGIFAGGVYKYDGQVNGEEFSCTYDSAMDKGTFQMKRATTKPAQ